MTIDHLVENDLGAIVPKGHEYNAISEGYAVIDWGDGTGEIVKGGNFEHAYVNPTQPKKGFAWYCWFCFWFSFGLIVAPFYLTYKRFCR